MLPLPRLSWLALTLILALALGPGAPPAPAADAPAVNWVALGPPGGCIKLLAIDPVTPTRLYTGTAGALYRSDDAGATWQQLPAPINNQFASALLIDPWEPQKLYLGTIFSRGILRSEDGGDTWQEAAPLAPSEPMLNYVQDIVADPHHPGTFYATHLYGRVHRSSDGGKSWPQLASPPTIPAHILDIAVDPAQPGLLYLATEAGVWRSADGGERWASASTGLPPGQVYALALDPQSPNTLYAGLEEGLYGSRDGGVSWQALNTTLAITWDGWLRVDPERPGELYAGGREGMYRSVAGGTAWEALGDTALAGVGVYDLAINPALPGELYAGSCSRGVWHSADGGATWEASSTGLNSQTVDYLAFDPHSPETLYMAIRDDLLVSDDDGGTWATSRRVGDAGRIRAIIADPWRPGRLFLGTSDGIGRSEDSGLTWEDTASWPLMSGPDDFIIDPSRPDTLFASSVMGIFRSTDAGDSWTQVAPAHRCTGHLATSAQEPRTIYASSGLGSLCRSSDGGESWQTSVSQSGWGGVLLSQLIVDPEDPARVYAGFYEEEVRRSTDRGEHWEMASTGLPRVRPGLFALAVSAGPPVVLYALMPQGVFRSDDRGDSWALAAPLPQPYNASLQQNNSLFVDPRQADRIFVASPEAGMYVADLGGATTAITNGAHNVRNTSATLVGTLGGQAGTPARFELSTQSGDYTDAAQLSPAASPAQAVSARAVGLRPGSTYFYRLRAGAGPAAVYGLEQRFTTTATPPELLAPGGASGAPGSTFALQARAFGPSSRLLVTVNGGPVGALNASAAGTGTFALAFTAAAPPGAYSVGVTEQPPGSSGPPGRGPDLSLTLTLDQTAPLRSDPSGTPVLRGLPPLFLPQLRR